VSRIVFKTYKGWIKPHLYYCDGCWLVAWRGLSSVREMAATPQESYRQFLENPSRKYQAAA